MGYIGLKGVIKSLLPKSLVQALSRMRSEQRRRAFARMSRADAFDAVYRKHLWDKDTHGGAPSGEGSYGAFAEDFLRLVQEVIKANKIESILDLGCGDFNIGSQVSSLVTTYTAADISEVIIARNKTRFSHLRNVTFCQIDACNDQLPVHDLVIIRQVLQHLANDEVESVLRNVERSGNRLVLVVEGGVSGPDARAYNIDLGTHGPFLRTEIGSGIEIDKAPFSRPAKHIATFTFRTGSVLRYYLWNL